MCCRPTARRYLAPRNWLSPWLQSSSSEVCRWTSSWCARVPRRVAMVLVASGIGPGGGSRAEICRSASHRANMRACFGPRQRARSLSRRSGRGSHRCHGDFSTKKPLETTHQLGVPPGGPHCSRLIVLLCKALAGQHIIKQDLQPAWDAVAKTVNAQLRP